jgi:hypothetical protein
MIGVLGVIILVRFPAIVRGLVVHLIYVHYDL